MNKLHTILMSGVMGVAMAVSASPAQAQDDPSYFMIEQNQTYPTKTDDFKEAWKTIIEVAKENNYKFPTLVSGSGPRISIATPMSSYADIDAMMAERDRVYAAGGKKFADAIDVLNGATFSEMTFMVKHMPEISNPPTDEDMESITMYEVSRLNIQPGNAEKFSEVMGKYKKGLEKADLLSSGRYNVYAGGMGSDSAYYFQSFAKNPVDLAEQNAKTNEMFKDNKDMQDLFGEYLSLETPGSFSASDNWKMAKELTYFPEK